MDITQTSLSPTRAHTPENERMMRAAAEQLEATFLAEMLKSAGVGESRKTFGGGAGEDQFSSFLVQEYARATVDRGGLGLSESIYRSLVRGQEQ